MRSILAIFTIVLFGFIQSQAQNIDMNQKLELESKGHSLEQVIKLIESQTGITIAYDTRQINSQKIVDVSLKNKTLNEALKVLFGDEFEVIDLGNRIILKRQSKSNGKSVLYGYITDAQSGETLPGASIYLTESPSTGAVSNIHGYFSLSVPNGNHQITISYIGYEPVLKLIDADSDRRLNIQLTQSASTLEEIVVIGRNTDIENLNIGSFDLDVKSIKAMPSLAGEPDPIKLLQLTPGVKSGGEGSSGLFVRGGNLDQNLILLDDAPVYNPTHLLGFFSVFHPDALKSIQFHKNNIPIEYGDRLASVLDIRMKDGNKDKFGAEGGIGLLSTRVLLEGPFAKGKSSYMAAFRRSYPDIFLGLSSSGGGNRVNFTDANVKLNVKISNRDNLFLSGYYGEDNLRFFDQYENNWGNYTTSLRWHHLYGKNIFGNLVAYHSNYQYAIETFADNRQTVDWTSSISESSIKYDFSLFPATNHLLKFGIAAIWRDYDPGRERSGLLEGVPSREVREYIGYLGHNWEVSSKVKLEYGVRYNIFQNHGQGTEYLLNEERVIVDTLFFDKDEVMKEFNTLAPRFSIKYRPNSKTELEASYNRNIQFQHEIRNATSPFNAFYVWLPSGLNLPQGVSDQFTLGYRYTSSKGYQFNIEGYYKKLKNQVDYRDHASIIQNNLVEQELRIGNGRAYGIETQLKKTLGKLSGWVQYTYSRTLRDIEGINDGSEYPAFFDQPHAVSLVANYNLNARSAFSMNWQYATGQPVNLPTGTFLAENTLVPIYEGRNNDRLPDFHRLDVSYTLRSRPGKWKNQSYWVFSLMNVYFRKNALSLDYLPNRDPITGNISDPLDKRIYKTYIFGLIPSVSWNFKF